MDEQELDGTLIWYDKITGCAARLPIPQVRDLIWAKETWRPREGYSNWDLLIDYAADGHTAHLQDDIDVGLANHAQMMNVFQKRDALAERKPGEAHPYVDKAFFAEQISTFIANAEAKLVAEKAGNPPDPLEALNRALSDTTE